MLQYLTNIDPYSAQALWLTTIACLLLAIQIICNAFDQAHIWARGGRPESRLLHTVRPHLVDAVQEAGYYLLALLIGNPVAVLGVGMIMRIPFEGIINVGVGRTFWDQGSEEKYFVVRIQDWELYRRPKINSVFGLIAKGVLGFVLLIQHVPISQAMYSMLHRLLSFL